MKHLFYKGWTKEALNGKTYYKWVHSQCCWCQESGLDVASSSDNWLLPDTDYIWAEMKGGYWGHKDGTPVSFEELMSDPYGGYA
jgi:hypothetical protein